MIPAKQDLLKKYYGCSDVVKIIDFILRNGFEVPLLEECTKIKLPYHAPGTEDTMPSIDQIEKGMRDNKLTRPNGFFDVCRVNNYVIKRGSGPEIIQVSGSVLLLCSDRLILSYRKPKIFSFYRNTRKYEFRSFLRSIPRTRNIT